MKMLGKDLVKEIFDFKNDQYCYYLFFFPQDYGCRIFDFYEENDIRIYSGILPFKKKVIRTITREEFEENYGEFMFYDITTYRVSWLYSNYSWNN